MTEGKPLVRVLIVSGTDDEAKSYAHHYLRKLHKVARELGYQSIHLVNPTLAKFHNTVLDFDPRFLVMNGHGGARAIVPYDQLAVLGVEGPSPEIDLHLTRSSQPFIFQKRIFYNFTCNNAKFLSYAAVAQGAECFVSWDRPFMFSSQDDDFQPEGEEVRRYFLAAMTFPLEMMKGKVALSAFNKTKKMFMHFTQRAERESRDIQAKYMFYNHNHMKLMGNPFARLQAGK